MAYPHKKIFNPKSKQEIHFIQTAKDTDGSLLEMESTYHSRSNPPAPHYHPHQSEDFIVLAGELTIKIGKGINRLKTGEHFHIPANTVHSMWNDTEDKTIVNWQVRPAMITEHLLEVISGLAVDGKTNKNGLPNILQMALTANKFNTVLRIAKPPYPIQKIIFTLISPISFWAGYQPMYKKYID